MKRSIFRLRRMFAVSETFAIIGPWLGMNYCSTECAKS